jgi:hypothetical protein
MVLYHSKLGYPDNVEYPTVVIDIKPHQDPHGHFEIPDMVIVPERAYEVNPSKAIGRWTQTHVFELRVEDNVVTKIGVRDHYSINRDIVMFLDPRDGSLFTCWSNLKVETKDDIDMSKYAEP